jgi:Flp pilus assembly protein TadD
LTEQVDYEIGGIGQAKKNSRIVVLAALLVVVAGIVLAVHWPVLSAETLSFDDNQYLTQNRLVQNPSWYSAKRFLTEVLEPSTVQGYYQPLSMISLMLDVVMGASADNLKPFHVTSLCLHVFNTLLIIVLLYMLFGQVWPAALVGLLFGVHPLTVEPISWIGERKTLLAAFFALWCFVTYLLYIRRHNWKLFAGCVLLYILAMMSKPTAILLPLLLLLLDFWPLNRLNKRSLVEKVPLLIIMTIFAFITLVSQGRSASVGLPGRCNVSQIPLVLCHNIIFYLYKIIWPVNLSSHYPVPSPLALSNPVIFIGVVGTCALSVVLLVSLRWTRALLTGCLFFSAAIFPTMGVISFTYVIASDRFAYLPSVGLLMILAWSLGKLWERVSIYFLGRIVIVIFIVAAVVCESVATRNYLQKWRNTETYYRHMLALSPHVASLYNGLGNALFEQGKVDEAVRYYRTAVRMEPNHYGFHNDLALSLYRQGQVYEAINHFYCSIRLNPNYPAAHKNLGIALASIGKSDDAIAQFGIALKFRPDDANMHYNLGVLLVQKGLTVKAIEEFRKALLIDPNHEKARIAFETEVGNLEHLGKK